MVGEDIYHGVKDLDGLLVGEDCDQEVNWFQNLGGLLVDEDTGSRSEIFR